jgi:hypothetical protein|tara:strand:+ start:891 stop:1055 length:165 start_codon:yes stop_codon:yes gene_type:complete
MAKVTVLIPEPKEDYDVSNQRQIHEALTTFKNQLNTSYQEDLRKEQEAFNFFMS